MRVAYLGPPGTFSEEALIEAGISEQLCPVPVATIYDAVMSVHDGEVDYALVPIENSVEGAVNATLDTLAIDAQDVSIVAELVHPIRECLIARGRLALDEIETIVSHSQPLGQCARFLRTELSRAVVMAAPSTADAVRMVSEHDGPWAALGNRLAAERYGCQVLRTGVEDVADNETRFVWLAPTGTPPGRPAVIPATRWKTAVVFWGQGSEAPGWLVSCLSEFAGRGVNLTRIESRPRKIGLGQYMFFVDLEGTLQDGSVREALDGVRAQVEVLRVLGCFPAA
ncbi:MAG: prephenate dehydratase [Solirubrobacteraceae bacterium]